jgi:hypothetical protein
MRRTRRFDVVALVGALTFMGSVASAQTGDPLARQEFDKEISLKLPNASIQRILQTVAMLTRVPFVLEFEHEAGQRTDIKMESTPARGVLVMMASTYGLEYSERSDGIVVRRKGMPSSPKRVVVGAWPGPQVQVEVQFRADGRVLSTPRVTTQMNQALEIKQGIEQAGGRAFLVIHLVPKRETAAGLELEMKVVATRSVTETRWIEDHRKETVTAGKGETLLFQTDDGIEAYLTSWQRVEK